MLVNLADIGYLLGILWVIGCETGILLYCWRESRREKRRNTEQR